MLLKGVKAPSPSPRYSSLGRVGTYPTMPGYPARSDQQLYKVLFFVRFEDVHLAN